MKPVLEPIAEYYSAKLAAHGATAQGVDWNGEAGQTLRFAQLSKLFDVSGRFSVNDLGCGYGALYDYLDERFAEVDYRGFDISREMVHVARGRHKGISNACFFETSILQLADYGVASGVFNVRLAADDDNWHILIEETLDHLNETSTRGFAFNCLTSYSDADKIRPYLYYADPCKLFDFCKRRYSKEVALLHDYKLFEFTIIVRKT